MVVARCSTRQQQRPSPMAHLLVATTVVDRLLQPRVQCFPPLPTSTLAMPTRHRRRRRRHRRQPIWVPQEKYPRLIIIISSKHISFRQFLPALNIISMATRAVARKTVSSVRTTTMVIIQQTV